ncbi:MULTISPECIES: hypothetical protein [unclassified Nocardia]|uniref:hypothetical protein n=1 Tax=unclassified Nocardia TaxID=2637762 RepID=UPI0033BE5511
MTTYAVVLETRPPTKRDFGGGNNVVEVAHSHAIEWPGPKGEDDWRDVPTLCGRSARSMQFEELPDPGD